MRALMPFLLIGCLAGSPAVVSADSDSQVNRASLTALTAISVVVEDLAPVAEKTGLTTATLQADVERRLRQAGIALTPDADAYVYVHVTVADPGPSLPLPYTVEVALMQEVTLPRGVRTRTPLQCPTWSLNRLGMATSDRVRTLVTDRVGEFIDQFVRAYQSVNPKR